MNAIYLMLPVALILGFGFLAAFVWMTNTGQYDDLKTPAHRMLLQDEPAPQNDVVSSDNETETPSPLNVRPNKRKEEKPGIVV